MQRDPQKNEYENKRIIHDNERYEAAAAFLPARLRKAALTLPEARRMRAEEFRLRAGRPMTVLFPEGEMQLLDTRVMPEELDKLCDLATEFSRYASAETIREGYLPVRGGFRIGLCGTAVMKDGANTNLRDLSSAVIRISREQKGIGEKLIAGLFENGIFQNTLILSPPGGGKTTLLRDLTRCLSAGIGVPAQRVSLIDERGEIAVVYRGTPQMDVGPRTDILDACPKALGIPILLRAMNPQIIVVDEITVQGDLQAVSLAAGCGVGLLATIHAADIPELLEKPLYAQLLENKIFRLAIRIFQKDAKRVYQLEKL